MRAVGVSWSARVITPFMPYSRHTVRMRSSSVATTRSSSRGLCFAAWYTHQIMGLPKISASGLPGIRVLA